MSRRIFFSTGEPSGELSASLLAKAMRGIDPDLTFAGIGGDRLAGDGFEIMWNTRGWASIGPLQGVSRIPKLLAIALNTIARLRRDPPALLVLVDFGAFNLRLAQWLRAAGYRHPIVYFFPPGAWLTNESQARKVAAASVPVTPFARQAEFYRSLGLQVHWFGHPLASATSPRALFPTPPTDGGTLALLPGSRHGELERHVPLVFDTLALMRAERPKLRAILGASDRDAAAYALAAVARRPGVRDAVEIIGGARAALERSDAALVASGTAVLEAALMEVPSAAFYVVSDAQAYIARRVLQPPFYTLPNLVLNRLMMPELLQEDATPAELARNALALLADPAAQLPALREMRAALGPPDALDRCAEFALSLVAPAR
jgi:lipid-A-disaccharide synthase